MHPALEGIDAKLDRADEHFHAVFTGARDFINEGKAYGHVGEFDTKRHAWIERARVYELPPLALGVLVGDYIHNLRSVLDHLTWALTKIDGATPDKRTQFPITEAPDDFNSAAGRQIPGLSADHRAAIQRTQPYHAADGFKTHPLWLLRELSNSDKHRVVQPTYAFVGDQQLQAPMRVDDEPGPLPVDRIVFAAPGTRMEDGTELVALYAKPTARQPTAVNMNGYFLVDVAFGDHAVTCQGLHGIRDAVRHVVATFAPDFPQKAHAR